MNVEKLAIKVKNILLKNGNNCTLSRVVKSTYNEDTEEYEDEILKIEGFAIMDNFNFQNVDGKTILLNDVKFMCSFEEAPKINDTLIFAEKEYKVININPLNPNGLCSIYYIIQARS